MGKHPLPGYGSVAHGNRLVRTRMLGGVGAGGEIPPATRFRTFCELIITLFLPKRGWFYENNSKEDR